MFGADAQAGEQRVVVQIPSTGTSKHGKSVALENLRLELTDPADSTKAAIVPHEDGAPGHFVITADPSLDVTNPVGIQVDAKADGRPGEGVAEISEPGLITFRSPDAAAIGTVAAVAEDLPT